MGRSLNRGKGENEGRNSQKTARKGTSGERRTSIPLFQATPFRNRGNRCQKGFKAKQNGAFPSRDSDLIPPLRIKRTPTISRASRFVPLILGQDMVNLLFEREL